MIMNLRFFPVFIVITGMAFSELSAFYHPTSPTRTISADPFAYVGVFWCKFMAALAMCFICIRVIAAMVVHISCHGFQMNRVYATSPFAQMINLQSFWNWANKHFVSNTMAASLPCIPDTKLGISFFVLASSPHPTRNASKGNFRVDGNFFKQPSNNRQIGMASNNRKSPWFSIASPDSAAIFTLGAKTVNAAFFFVVFGARFIGETFTACFNCDTIGLGHRDLLQVNDGLGDVRLQPCAALSF